MARELTTAELYAEIDDLLRTMPQRQDIWDSGAWLGRSAVVLERWKPLTGVEFGYYRVQAQSGDLRQSQAGHQGIAFLLHQAHNDIRLSGVGPIALAVEAGMAFDYFDEVRKVIETAADDVLFIDPYLDA